MGVCIQGLTGKAGHGLHWCCGDRTVRESAPATENRDWTILLTTKCLILSMKDMLKVLLSLMWYGGHLCICLGNSKCFNLSSDKVLIEDLLGSAGSPEYLHQALTPLCGPD